MYISHTRVVGRKWGEETDSLMPSFSNHLSSKNLWNLLKFFQRELIHHTCSI